MPTSITDPYGNKIETCSISTALKATLGKEAFKNEAAWGQSVKRGAFHVLKQKIKNGEVPVNSVIGRSPAGHRMVLRENLAGHKVLEIKYPTGQPFKLEIDLLKTTDKGLFKDVDWDFGEGLSKLAKADPLGPAAANGLPVASTSKSVGNLTNEEAAEMFVKTKDQLAKEAGLNIKGASAKLDDLVYKTIGDQVGYTPTEMKAKVDAYKATGKKLSALKKKVLPKTGDATKAPTQAAVKKAAEAVKKEELKPEEVPQVWDSEAVAKAYVKAKDHVVANNNNGWTLYTKNPDFDAEILKWAQLDLGPIKQETLATSLADYIATKQKLSVLKKQMIKKGELKPQADTLKGGNTATKPKQAPDETGAGQQGKTTEDPTVVGPKQQLTDQQQADIFQTWETLNLPLSTSGKNLLVNAKKLAKDYGLGDDVLPILRAVDAGKTAKFGYSPSHNKKLYEKKVLEEVKNPTPAYTPPPSNYSSTGGLQTPKVNATFGELPEDSSLFQYISPSSMRQVNEASMASLKVGERAALKKYTSSYYNEMNNHLRANKPLTGVETVVKTIKAASQGMRPLPQAVRVSRGTSARGLGVNSVEEIDQMIGKTFVEKGYSSTSVGDRSAFGGQIGLVIEVPAGHPAAYVQPFSHFPGENELLLERGTVYRILKVEVTNGKRIVTVRAEGVKK